MQISWTILLSSRFGMQPFFAMLWPQQAKQIISTDLQWLTYKLTVDLDLRGSYVDFL